MLHRSVSTMNAIKLFSERSTTTTKHFTSLVLPCVLGIFGTRSEEVKYMEESVICAAHLYGFGSVREEERKNLKIQQKIFFSSE